MGCFLLPSSLDRVSLHLLCDLHDFCFSTILLRSFKKKDRWQRTSTVLSCSLLSNYKRFNFVFYFAIQFVWRSFILRTLPCLGPRKDFRFKTVIKTWIAQTNKKHSPLDICITSTAQNFNVIKVAVREHRVVHWD